MADEPVDPTQQESVEMPNGVVLTGVGDQDVDAARESFEERHEALTGQPIDQPPATERPARGKKRIDQLVHEREQEKARADAAESRAKELEARLSKPATEPTTQPAAQPETQPAAAATRAKPEEAEIGTKYATLSAYFEDLADWKAEQREAALIANFDARLTASIEADRASRTRVDHVQTIFAHGRAAYPDFDATLATADAIKVPPSHQDAILKMPNPERVMYALAKDHAQLTELVTITDPVLLGMRLAQFVAPAEAVAPPASTPAAVRTTNAPAPPQPVGAGTRTAQPSLAELAQSGNYEAYKAKRAADRGVRTH